jgi:uncharacterized DUF497 family protein
VEFEWDPAKSERNVRERGLPFDLAAPMFDRLVVEQKDERRDYGEVRTGAVGLSAGMILFCVYTDRGNIRRIISLRLANRRERNAFRAAQAV